MVDMLWAVASDPMLIMRLKEKLANPWMQSKRRHPPSHLLINEPKKKPLPPQRCC
jgi:hypothetical protein